MKQPTEQEIKEFWEWCGWEPLYDRYKGNRYIVLWQYGVAGECTEDSNPPPIDLNGLFLYAVPIAVKKLKDRCGWTEWWAYKKILLDWLELCKNKDLGVPELKALALFWAIKSVMESEKCGTS